MTRNGDIVKVTRQKGEPIKIADLEGQPLKDPKTGLAMDEREFSKLTAYGTPIFMKSPDAEFRPGKGPQFFALWRTDHRSLWYWTRQGRLVSYDAMSRRAAGTIAPGPAAGGPAADAFLPPVNAGYYDGSTPRTLAT